MGRKKYIFGKVLLNHPSHLCPEGEGGGSPKVIFHLIPRIIFQCLYNEIFDTLQNGHLFDITYFMYRMIYKNRWKRNLRPME